jgi:hypothetical protein
VSEGPIFHILDEITRTLPGVDLHIGGGEPLLNLDLIVKVVSRIRGKRIFLEYVETNGALLREGGEEKLRLLRDAGLNRVLLSISPFHREFIPLEETLDAYRAIVRVFGEEGIFPWHPGYLPFLERSPAGSKVSLEDHFLQCSPGEVRHQLTSIMYIHPGGRGAYLLARHMKLSSPEMFLGHQCSRNLSSPVHAHIDQEGNYLAGFCSGLRIGTAAALDLERLYGDGADLAEHPVLRMLAGRGLGELYRHACALGFEPAPEGYVAPCHLCLDLRLFLYNVGFAPDELYPRFFYEELLRRRTHSRTASS